MIPLSSRVPFAEYINNTVRASFPASTILYNERDPISVNTFSDSGHNTTLVSSQLKILVEEIFNNSCFLSNFLVL